MTSVRVSLYWVGMLLLLVLIPSKTDAQSGYRDLYDFSCTNLDFQNHTSSGICYPNKPEIVAQGTDGNLYGMGSDYFGRGVIFRMTPDGTLATLAYFEGINNSSGGLTLGPDGNFYGVTYYGGANTIFRVTSTGEVSPLYSFEPTDGPWPTSPPVIGDDGYLYGTALNFGYKISISGDFKLLTSSIPSSSGLSAQGSIAPLLLASDGNFYGSIPEQNNSGGGTGGTIFQMTPTGTVTVLYNFEQGPINNYPQGDLPYGGLVEGTDENLYGTTRDGGTEGCGVAYQLTTTGTIGMEFSFSGATSGCHPYAGLVAASDGNLYGVTSYASQFTGGTFFSVTTSGAFNVLYTLTPDCSGSFCHGGVPYATPMQATDGTVYGMTSEGGIYNEGVFYSLNVGAPAFVSTIQPSGAFGQSIGILGQGFNNTSSVSFNGVPASYNVVSDTYLTATVPVGATTGPVTVVTAGSFPTGTNTLSSNRKFRLTVGPTVVTTDTSITAPTITYGNSASVTVSVSSGQGTVTGSVSLAVDDGSPLTQPLSGGSTVFSISALAVGSHSLTASYATQGSFGASSTTVALQVNQATPTISISNTPSNAVYGGSFTPTYSYIGDGIASVTSGTPGTCVVSGSVVRFIGAGTCTLTAHATAGANYSSTAGSSQSFTIGQANPTISINNVPTNAKYGGGFAPTYAYTGDGTTSVTSSTTATCTVSGTVVNFVGVGACILTAHATASLNSAAATGSLQSFSIGQATPAISISNTPSTPVYAGSFTPVYAYTGNGKTSTTSSTSNTCTVSNKGVVAFVGTGTCTLTAHATASTNYAAATGSLQSFTIAQATTTISIKNIPGNSKKGGSFTPAYNYIGDGTASMTSSTPATCTVSGTVVNFVGSGTCTLTAQATAGTNYAATTGSPQSFKIK